MHARTLCYMESFPDYLQMQLDRKQWTRADLSRASGLDQSLLGRWSRGDVAPAVDSARTFAATIGRPLLEVLVAAGLLTAAEAKQRADVPPDPAVLTDDQLLAEIRRRMASRDGQQLTREQMDADPERYQAIGASSDSGPGQQRSKRTPRARAK